MAKPDSKRPASRATSRKKENPELDSDIEEVHGSPPPKKPATVPVNGKAPAKPKAKAKPESSTAKKAAPVEEIDDSDHGSNANAKKRKRTATAGTEASSSKRLEQLIADNKRLSERCKSLTAENKKLSEQLEELFAIRNTEPESLLAQHKAEVEIERKTRQEVVNELTKQLASVQPLAQSNSAVLHLITREAADEEKIALEREVEELKTKAEHLEGKAKDLDVDLRGERQRNAHLQRLTQRNPGPVNDSRTMMKTKTGQSIELYEQLTNVCVVGVKNDVTPRSSDKVSTMYTCIYTCDPQQNELDQMENPSIPALHFTLEFLPPNSSPAPESSDWPFESAHYCPHDLDKESDEWVARLDYYATEFHFAAPQLPLFMRQMRDQIISGGTVQDAQGGGSDAGSVMDLDRSTEVHEID